MRPLLKNKLLLLLLITEVLHVCIHKINIFLDHTNIFGSSIPKVATMNTLSSFLLIFMYAPHCFDLYAIFLYVIWCNSLILAL